MSAHRTIRPLDADVADRVVSEQVIPSLAAAVKELLENALDAGASAVEVRLVEYGAALIEVSDNGRGIAQASFEHLGRLHATSKIETEHDIAAVDTLGFRGEALAALAQLCEEITITTATAETQPLASRLVLGCSGEGVIASTHAARAVGTTVRACRIFKSLPVRRRELERSSRKEYTKALHCVRSYALANPFVKFSLSLDSAKGKSMALSCSGRQTTEQPEFTEKLRQTYKEMYPSDSSSIINLLCSVDVDGDIVVKGIIALASTAARSLGDRHFWFLNHRPVDLPKLSRLVKDTVKQNHHSEASTPAYAYAMHIFMPSNRYDVNASADKRAAFIKDDRQLCEALQASLMDSLRASKHVPSIAVSRDQSIVPFVASSATPLAPLLLPTSSGCDNETPDRYPALEASDVVDINRRIAIAGVESSSPRLSLANSLEFSSPPVVQEIPTQMEALPTPTAQLTRSSPTFSRVSVVDTGISDIKKAFLRRANILQNRPILASPPSYQTHTPIQEVDDTQQSLHKGDFARMQALGQFNLGFIIALKSESLGVVARPWFADGDLFIVDQHAADEKRLYEQFISKQIDYQPLLHPKEIELTVDQYFRLETCRQSFEKIGYRFSLAHGPDPTRSKIYITQQPADADPKKDIEEALEYSGSIADLSDFVLSRVYRTCASRACRSAIMIGDAIDSHQQARVVQRLSGLDNPWSCPHGRPTVRHVLKLDELQRGL